MHVPDNAGHLLDFGKIEKVVPGLECFSRQLEHDTFVN